MSTFTAPTREDATHWSRSVPFREAAMGAQLSATAGQSPRRLNSLPMVEAFLNPLDEVTYENLHDTVNYLNPQGLAKWITETIGDVELGEKVGELAEDGRAYGYQVRDLKPLLQERLSQYMHALSDETDPQPGSGESQDLAS